MALPKLAIGLAAILVLAWVLSLGLGVGFATISTLLLATFFVVLLQKFKVFKPFPMIKQKQETWALVILAAAVFFLGGFASLPVVGDFLNPTAVTGAFTGIEVPAAEITDTAASASTCAASVNQDLLGKSSTATLTTYDQASNTPRTSSVTGAINYNYQVIDKNGNVGPILSSKGAATITDINVGDLLKIWNKGDNTTASYYLMPKEVCIDAEQVPVELTAYTKATITNMQVTGYDSTGAAALSAGTNTGVEDYDITVGADGSDNFYLEWKVNDADEVYNFYAVAIIAQNDIESVEPTDSVWTPAIRAKFLNIPVANSTAGSDCGDTSCNISGGYDTVYTLSAPKMIEEWKKVTYNFDFNAGSTDPTNDDVGTLSDQDLAIICSLDADYAVGSDGNIHLNYYVEDSAQADVGIADYTEITVPKGKKTCTVIEGI